MSATSRPATPDQVRLIIGLSCIPALPMVIIAMLYVTNLQATPDHASAWRAFAFALACGAAEGLLLVRFVPIFGGSLPSFTPARNALPFGWVAALLVAVVIGRLVHQGLPVTMGFIAGVDAVLATVLLLRSLRGFSQTATHPQ
jgi:hypothetical protein